MSDEDRKYLRSIKNATPTDEVFEQLVQMLSDLQEKTDSLLKTTLKPAY